MDVTVAIIVVRLVVVRIQRKRKGRVRFCKGGVGHKA